MKLRWALLGLSLFCVFPVLAEGVTGAKRRAELASDCSPELMPTSQLLELAVKDKSSANSVIVELIRRRFGGEFYTNVRPGIEPGSFLRLVRDTNTDRLLVRAVSRDRWRDEKSLLRIDRENRAFWPVVDVELVVARVKLETDFIEFVFQPKKSDLNGNPGWRLEVFLTLNLNSKREVTGLHLVRQIMQKQIIGTDSSGAFIYRKNWWLDENGDPYRERPDHIQVDVLSESHWDRPRKIY